MAVSVIRCQHQYLSRSRHLFRLGAFVLAHAFGGTRCADRTARAAGWASLQMVRQLAPGLAAQRSWVKLTPVLNGYGRGRLHRYSLTRSVRLNQLPQPSRKSASTP